MFYGNRRFREWKCTFTEFVIFSERSACSSAADTLVPSIAATITTRNRDRRDRLAHVRSVFISISLPMGFARDMPTVI